MENITKLFVLIINFVLPLFKILTILVEFMLAVSKSNDKSTSDSFASLIFRGEDLVFIEQDFAISTETWETVGLQRLENKLLNSAWRADKRRIWCKFIVTSMSVRQFISTALPHTIIFGSNIIVGAIIIHRSNLRKIKN